MKQFKVTKSITNRDTESLKLYLKDVSHIPMLTPEEEVEVAEKAKNGDKRALDKLVTSNLRFVISVAKPYQGHGVPLIDLINSGNEGLITAAEKFDPTKGFKFISYAVWWIRQAIIQSLSSESRTIRIPVSQTTSYSKINKTIVEFEQTHERTPSDEELSKILNISIDKLNEIRSGNLTTVSVETPFGNEDEGCLLDVIENKNSPASDFLTKEDDRSVNLHILLNKFSDRESDILRMTYGLDGVQQLPYDEVGKRFGLTGERIRQINNGILETIRKNYSKLAYAIL